MQTATTGRSKSVPRIPQQPGRRASPRWRLVALVAVGAVAAAVALAVTGAASAARSAEGRYSTTIRRTAYGIPHVLAHDYGGLGYGYGYAFAQDNACVLADEVVTVRARRSAFFGPDALSTDALGAPTSNLDSDTYYQALRDARTVERLLARPAPLGPTAQARELVDGYVAGYNRYLRDTGVARLPDPTCRGRAWVGPLTALDVWKLVYAVDVFSGAGAFKQAIATATPAAGGVPTPPPSKAAVPALPVAANGDAVPSTAEDVTGDVGSNGWALGAAATRAHDGMLLANPHVPWTGDARLYQVQLTIPGVLDVTGAALYGVPVVMLGHTERMAWTLTASHAQHASIYRLSLVPGDPTSYLVDGRAVAMGHRIVRVSVRGSGGKQSTVTRTLYTSRYGPVLATGWTDTTAYAIRDANADNVRSVNEWLAIDRARSLAELRAAHQTYQGLAWMYTLATDTGGGTFFADTSVVPHLTDRQAVRCVLQIDPERPDILDGSTSACDWGRDPDAVEPGIFAPSQAPTLTRTDYVANSNNSPLLANPAQPVSGYPAAYDTRTQPELRPRLSLTMIAQRVAGTDGLGAPGFTLPTLQADMLGDRVESADLGRSDVVDMCRADPVLPATDGTQVDVRAACDILARWDATARPDSAGAVLWSAFFDRLGGDPSAPWWRVPYDSARPVATPSGINGDDPRVRQALADTVEEFDAEHTALAATPGQTMHWDGIPLHGCEEQAGCFNVVAASPGSGRNAIDPSGDNAAQGSSFIMAVELTGRGPVARTILTYSESANPASRHYSDQTVLFSRRQWVVERFTEAQIDADPTLQITALRG